ncbi:MAG: FkbM family methyltransferase [Candidatus Micrarchaeota archaeon]
MLGKIIKKVAKPFFGRNLGGRFPLLGRAYAEMIRNRIVPCEVQGFKMYVNLQDRIASQQMFLEGVFEPEQTHIFKKLVRRDTVYVDVGAHIGYFTLLVAKNAKDGVIYAFEPQSQNFSLLRKNVHANRFHNVRLFKKAVSDKANRRLKLYCNTSNSGNNSLLKEDIVSDYVWEEVETVTLDGALKNAKKVDLMKIDVEGAELLVLKGAEKTFRKNKKMKVLIEYAPAFYRKPTALIDVLKKLGFKIKVISRGKPGHLEPLTDELLAETIRTARSSPAYNLNLLCERQ